MAGKEVLPVLGEQRAILYRVGDDLRREFTEGNGDISAALHDIGVDSLYVTNKLVLRQLHYILASERIFKKEFEVTEGRVESQIDDILRRKDRQNTSIISRFLDIHPEYLVHLRMIDWLLGIQEVSENLEFPWQ